MFPPFDSLAHGVVGSDVHLHLGQAFNFGDGRIPVIEADVAHMAAFLKAKLPQLVKFGLVKPLTIEMWEGGFAAVPDGLQYMRDDKVSAEKIVYSLLNAQQYLK